MVVQIVLLVVCLVVGVLALFLEWPSPRVRRLIAKLPQFSRVPLLGLGPALLVTKDEEVLDYFKECCDANDGLAAGFLMGRPYVMIANSDVLEVLLSSKNHIKKSVQYNTISKWLNDGILTSSGTKWHSRRKMLTPAFHFEILKDSVTVFGKSSSVLCEKLLQTEGKAVDVHYYVTKCALDVICEAAMGISLDSQNDSSKEYVETIFRVCNAIGLKEVKAQYLKDWMFELSPLGKEYYKDVRKLHDFTESAIKQRMQMNKNNTDKSEVKKRKAFLDILLDHQAKDSEFTFLDTREEVDTFMFEGHDTTSSAIEFSIYLLGLHQDVQETAYREVESVLGSTPAEELTSSDLNNLSYLEKVIKETLRLFPSVPMFSRGLTQDLVLKDGRVIPAGATAIALPYVLHRSAKYFENPLKFDPERFNEDEARKRHPFCYVPFSAGPRNCIGQKFAMMEIKSVLAALLKKFKLESIPSTVKIFPYVILKPNEPLKVKFVPRQ